MCLNNIPSLQISHRCMVIELQRFPFLWKRMDEALGNFLREGLEALENMIAHLIAMEVCWNLTCLKYKCIFPPSSTYLLLHQKSSSKFGCWAKTWFQIQLSYCQIVFYVIWISSQKLIKVSFLIFLSIFNCNLVVNSLISLILFHINRMRQFQWSCYEVMLLVGMWRLHFLECISLLSFNWWGWDFWKFDHLWERLWSQISAVFMEKKVVHKISWMFGTSAEICRKLFF